MSHIVIPDFFDWKEKMIRNLPVQDTRDKSRHLWRFQNEEIPDIILAYSNYSGMTVRVGHSGPSHPYHHVIPDEAKRRSGISLYRTRGTKVNIYGVSKIGRFLPSPTCHFVVVDKQE